VIIKGTSRAGPRQLAYHLQRTDTNERVEILDIQSFPEDLGQALREWQCISEGTRGRKGLYHANIDPDARYKMTPEQWQRAADVLEQELGLTGQPRVMILHEKEGREHIHIVWQRTNTDTMTLVPDSHNYYAHERASLALETEFGHEHVPGKHAKRDRTVPPPKAEINDAEWQQAERTGANPRARKATITALYHQCDNGQSLRAALSGAGYVLAKGDRRDYVIVDAQGEVHSLARQIKGVSARDLHEFMADIDRDSIPTVEQAKALQSEIAARPNSAASPQAEPSPPQSTPEPDWHPPGLAPEQLARLKSILKEQQDEEDRSLRNRQEVERTRTAEAIDCEIAEKLETLDAMQQAARSRYDREHNAERGGIHRVLAAIMAWINPAKAAEEQRQQAQACEEFLHQQQNERASQIARLKTDKESSFADLSERHEQQRRDQTAKYEQELVRLTRDHDAAQRLVAEFDERHRQPELAAKQQLKRDDPLSTPPRGPENSRSLQPEQSRFLKPQVATPLALFSQFIPTTAQGVAIPAQGSAPAPVTASRFLTKSPEAPKSVPPQYPGINSHFLRPLGKVPQPTAGKNNISPIPPPAPISSRFLQSQPSSVHAPEPAQQPPRYSRFISTTPAGVAIPAQSTAPASVIASRIMTTSQDLPKSAPPQYSGLNSKFLPPHEETPRPTAAPNGKPSQPPPNTPRPPR